MMVIGMKLLYILFGVVMMFTTVSSFPQHGVARERRSPQNENPWCQTAFLNFSRQAKIFFVKKDDESDVEQVRY